MTRGPLVLALHVVLSGTILRAAANAPAPSPAAALDRPALLRLFGHANAFKEGDLAIGVAAPDEAARTAARERLSRLTVGELASTRFVDDEVSRIVMQTLDAKAATLARGMTIGELRRFCLDRTEDEILRIRGGLTPEAIAAVAKLMSNDELVKAAAKLSNPPHGLTLGARGYFGSRIQPNSPTDDPEEVLYSTLEGLSYGCGDAVIGINPVDSDRRNVRRLEETLADVVRTFGLSGTTRYSVLAHIDDQMAVDEKGLVDVAFQSIGGTARTNRTFNIDNAKMLKHLGAVPGQYFETGQGSSFTNGADEGLDMVTCEARAYGLARAYATITKNWTILNDVAGFIGPEVFSRPDQLLRACLEDLFMGKMHGLCMGLDICSTYHMGVEIDDLDKIMEAVLRAGPAYYMAVAGKNDPMLSYITTAFRDHPRLRARLGLKVTDPMKAFFVTLGVMNPDGSMTARAGDTAHVYVQYRRRKGDTRPEPAIRAEARAALERFQKRGLDLGYGHDGAFGMPKEVKDRLYRIYAEAKRVLKLELSPGFLAQHADALVLETEARDRTDYVLHPPRGERLTEKSLAAVREWRAQCEKRKELPDVQIVVSDGLNAESVTTKGQLEPFLVDLRKGLEAKGLRCGRLIIVRNGRVRAGYAVGREMLGADSTARAATVHVVGERPGNDHNTYSAYIGLVPRARWKQGIDHNVVRVVSGVSLTATPPARAAQQTLEILLKFFFGPRSGSSAP